MLELLNPTLENKVLETQSASWPDSLSGAIVGIISNGKEGTENFFAALSDILTERFSVQAVEFRVKSNYSAPAESTIIDEARNWQLAITGIGD